MGFAKDPANKGRNEDARIGFETNGPTERELSRYSLH